jgi:hypothetical protein
MFPQSISIVLLSLVLSFLPTGFHSANAADVLWNPSFGNDLSGATAGLVPGASIRQTGLLVYRSNPDELIMKIIMSDSFEEKPFSGKGRNLGMMLWIGKDRNCVYSDRLDCDRMQTIWAPSSPSTYPASKSSEYVFVYDRDQKLKEAPKSTGCKAPWWIDSTFKSRDTWNFALSITCLSLPKEFGWYAYSSIDLGQVDVKTDFSSILSATYPFHDLAANAANNNQTSTGSEDKLDLIYRLKQLSKSGKSQSNALTATISKTKKLSSVKRKTYQKTLKEYNLYVKDFDGQISELEAIPFGADFKSQALDLITEHQSWLRKLSDILGALVNK